MSTNVKRLTEVINLIEDSQSELGRIFHTQVVKVDSLPCAIEFLKSIIDASNTRSTHYDERTLNYAYRVARRLVNLHQQKYAFSHE